jgi:predicted lipoprotein with Yx(FWY)xxD motif
MPRNRVPALIAAVAAVLALGACSSNGPTQSTSDPAAAASAAAAAPAADQPSLTAKEVGDLGTVVVDKEGYTLYRFDNDKANPPTTKCVDACATKWPPVVVDRTAKLRIAGIEDSAIGLLERPDGTAQLTIKGWAVYRYSGDKAPGATDGQGVGGTWYAITPEGKKATPV